MLVNVSPVAKGGESHRPASGGKPGCLGRGDPAFCLYASRLRLLFDSIIESIAGPNRLTANPKFSRQNSAANNAHCILTLVTAGLAYFISWQDPKFILSVTLGIYELEKDV